MSIVEKYNDSHAAVITLNNGEKGNVLNIENLEGLLDAFESAGREKDIRVILLRSNKDTF